MRIEIHVLQNFALRTSIGMTPARPKTRTSAGIVAPASAASAKNGGPALLSGERVDTVFHRGHRTKRLLDEAERRLTGKDRTSEAIRRAVTAALAGGGSRSR